MMVQSSTLIRPAMSHPAALHPAERAGRARPDRRDPLARRLVGALVEVVGGMALDPVPAAAPPSEFRWLSCITDGRMDF
jgi:hypothetical protein